VNRMKDLSVAFAAGVVLASVSVASILHAQAPPDAPAATPSMMPRAIVQTPGSVQVTRLTDTTFVVVKDQGDGQVVTLFSTETGLVQKKHSGRFLY
jgi:hypothetical protein